MAFRPKNSTASKSSKTQQDNPGGLFPVPKAGNRKARVSLIVDLGVQNRPDFEEKQKDGSIILKPQKPCQQVAVFADLTHDVVDYGGIIGKQPYRLLLNKTFAGDITGINFMFVPPKDNNGKIIEGKPYTLHPASLLTKLAKATRNVDVIESGEIEQLLNCPFMAQVEVNEKDSGKEDSDGKPIIYRNVNYKGCSEVPEDDDGEVMPVNDLHMPAKCITFDNAKVEDIKFIRKKLIETIKLANDYAGSQIEKAIVEFEKQMVETDTTETPKTPAKKAVKSSPKVEDIDEEESDDSPF